MQKRRRHQIGPGIPNRFFLIGDNSDRCFEFCRHKLFLREERHFEVLSPTPIFSPSPISDTRASPPL